MSKYSKTTKAQFEIFKKECEFWLDYFGLKGWLVEYEHTRQKNRACVGWKVVGRIAVITLSTDWEEDRIYPISENDIRRCSFHEVVELLLSRLDCMAKGLLTNNNEAVEEETHNIIRTLENTVFKKAI